MESSQLYCRINETSFYFMRLSLKVDQLLIKSASAATASCSLNQNRLSASHLGIVPVDVAEDLFDRVDQGLFDIIGSLYI
jgi:hypothetical protein